MIKCNEGHSVNTRRVLVDPTRGRKSDSELKLGAKKVMPRGYRRLDG
jgi:hypothetical protein